MKNTCHVSVKPLSTNSLYVFRKGRRHKTKDYEDFVRTLWYFLPPKKQIEIPDGDLLIYYEFGVSRSFDSDNCVKACQDVISQKYGFNDNRIRFHSVLKTITKRGDEFIRFRIMPYREGNWQFLTSPPYQFSQAELRIRK